MWESEWSFLALACEKADHHVVQYFTEQCKQTNGVMSGHAIVARKLKAQTTFQQRSLYTR